MSIRVLLLSSIFATHSGLVFAETQERKATANELEIAQCDRDPSNFRIINVDQNRHNPFDLVDCDRGNYSNVGCNFLHMITIQTPRAIENLGLEVRDQDVLDGHRDNLQPYYVEFCGGFS